MLTEEERQAAVVKRVLETLGVEDLTPDELRAIAVAGFERGFAPPAVREPLVVEARRAWSAWASAAERVIG